MPASFSVITPSYQQGCFIEKTIQSVISQSDVSVDYVVCDGGSQDETISILKRYRPHLRWLSESDRGQADAVNKGLSMTKGDIIAWINSDDIYYPNAFKVVSAFFEDNPNVLAVYGQADWIDECDRVIATYPTKPWYYQQLKKECYLCQPAVFFRRRLVDQLGNLDDKLEYCMDYELWLRYGRQNLFAYLPVKLAGSRIYASNKTIGGRLAAHREANYMLKNKLGYSTQKWIFGYSKLQVEDNTGISADVSAGSMRLWLIFSTRFLGAAIANCWQLNRQAMPVVLLKVFIYQLAMNSRLLELRRSPDIEKIVSNQPQQEQPTHQPP